MRVCGFMMLYNARLAQNEDETMETEAENFFFLLHSSKLRQIVA